MVKQILERSITTAAFKNVGGISIKKKLYENHFKNFDLLVEHLPYV